LPRTGLNISVRLTEDPAAPAVERSRWFLIGLLFCAAVAVVVIGVRYYFLPPSTDVAMGMPHQNHNPQHGGVFFMAEDNIHHLEGVLVKPETFRLYLYDAYTIPLDPDSVKETRASVQVGDAEDAKAIPMKVGADGQTLEANVGPKIDFPATYTLKMHLPGEPPDAKPELFTFHYKDFSVVTNTSGVKP
jgi:hypothetical protein